MNYQKPKHVFRQSCTVAQWRFSNGKNGEVLVVKESEQQGVEDALLTFSSRYVNGSVENISIGAGAHGEVFRIGDYAVKMFWQGIDTGLPQQLMHQHPTFLNFCSTVALAEIINKHKMKVMGYKFEHVEPLGAVMFMSRLAYVMPYLRGEECSESDIINTASRKMKFSIIKHAVSPKSVDLDDNKGNFLVDRTQGLMTKIDTNFKSYVPRAAGCL